MSHQALRSAVELLQQVTCASLTSLDDRQLLELFAEHRDERAFHALVQRHGPMVFAVCRRTLRDYQAAEDAFQATFLILSQKSQRIRQPELLGNWLYGVACRTAMKARSQLKRLPETEPFPEPTQEEEPIEALAWREMQGILDEEVQRLPERYRKPMVLCCFQGLTYSAAATALGWSLGTVAGRLSRAKDALRARLQRRGLILSASILTALLEQQCLLAEVPTKLSTSTIHLATLPSLSAVSPSLISKNVLLLQKEVMQAMIVSKLSTSLMRLCLIIVLGGGLWFHFASAGEGPTQNTTQPPKKADQIRERMKNLDLEKQQLTEDLKVLEQQNQKRDNEWKLALDDYSEALQLLVAQRQKLGDPRALLDLAKARIKQGRLQEAQQLLQKLVAQLESRDQQLQALKQLKEGLVALQKATKNRPQAQTVVKEFAVAFEKLKRALLEGQSNLSSWDSQILNQLSRRDLRVWDLTIGIVLEGEILGVDRKAKQVLLSVGSANGVKKGMKYRVYEHGKSSPNQTGIIEVDKVDPNWSLGRIVQEFSPRAKIEKGNIIQTDK